jgi:hypothetical protein
MKALFVYESMNFERGQEPKSAMGIGGIALKEKEIKEWFEQQDTWDAIKEFFSKIMMTQDIQYLEALYKNLDLIDTGYQGTFIGKIIDLLETIISSNVPNRQEFKDLITKILQTQQYLLGSHYKRLRRIYTKEELQSSFSNVPFFQKLKGKTNLSNLPEAERKESYKKAEQLLLDTNYGKITTTPIQRKNETIQFTTINGMNYIIQKSGYVRKRAPGRIRTPVIHYDDYLNYEELAEIALNSISKEKKKHGES